MPVPTNTPLQIPPVINTVAVPTQPLPHIQPLNSAVLGKLPLVVYDHSIYNTAVWFGCMLGMVHCFVIELNDPIRLASCT